MDVDIEFINIDKIRLVSLPIGFFHKKLIRKLPKNKIKNRTGMIIGSLSIIGFAGMLSNGSSFTSAWLCQCNCGNYRLLFNSKFAQIKCCKICSFRKQNWKWLDLI